MFTDKSDLFTMPTLCAAFQKGADKKQEIITKKYGWIYSNVMLSVSRKIFASLQDRKLGEKDGEGVCPVKQKLEHDKLLLYRESTNVHEDLEKARMC